MQFKRVGTRIQVLAYRGYDKDKKRSVVKMMGSLTGYSFTPSVGLIDSLTDEEKTELQSYIDSERSRIQGQADSDSARSALWSIRRTADALGRGVPVTPELADHLWAEMATLSSALRKAGHPRPPKRPAAPDGRQADLLATPGGQAAPDDSGAPGAV